jgi:hypothetical protein
MQLDDALAAYAAGLAAEIEILRKVDGLAREQREAWARNQLAGLGALATRRAQLMTELAGAEDRIAPFRDHILARLAVAREVPAFAAAEARSQEAQALVRQLVENDRSFLSDLEGTLEERRREVQTLDAGGATLAAYRRVVLPAPASAKLVDQRG